MAEIDFPEGEDPGFVFERWTLSEDGIWLLTPGGGGGGAASPFSFIYSAAGFYLWEAPSGGEVDIKAWGAGGGGGTTSPPSGGGGGYAAGKFPVVEGDLLYIICGQGGRRGVASSYSGYALGGGGRAKSSNSDAPGGGGGYSGIFLNGITQADAVIIAGGGGGAGCNGSGTTNSGGAGGGTSGVDGGSAATPAGGGTSSSGGAGSSYGGNAGSALTGGDGDSDWGSGGGGGYYGGGGGGESPGVVSGGGGGSGFIDGIVTDSTLTAGSGTTPANSSDPLVILGHGTGRGQNTDGSDGLVRFMFIPE